MVQIERVIVYIMIPLSPKPKSGYEVPKDLRIRVEELGRCDEVLF